MPEEKKSEEKKPEDNKPVIPEERVSVPLTPENAAFERSAGGLISMTLTKPEGEPEKFERVVVFRCFPVTDRDEFLSVREPDSKKMGRGKEIGMIRRMSDFSEETQALLLEELERRYFSPEITRINSVKDKFGYIYWDTDTTAGKITFVMNNPFSNVRRLEDGRIFVNDIDGNNYQIPDPEKLDPASYRRLEVYI